MAKKKEVKIEEGKSKRERLLEKLLEEKKIAEKADEALKLGFLEDFNEVKRDNYKITGILGYDLNVGGLKRGSFHVVYGNASSGKTTTTLNLLEGIQMTQPDAITLYLDSETAVDERFLSRMPYLNQENIIFLKEQTAEYALNKVVEYAKENLVDYIVIDSLDSLISIKETEKGLDEAVMMEKARVLSRALPILQSACRENNLTVIIIQQVRTQFSGVIVTEGRSGGKAMQFYPSTVVKLSNISSQNEIVNDMVVSRYLKIKNEKSKIGNPYAETYSFINTSSDKSSIDRIKECLNYACDSGIIEKKGAWVYIPDENGEIQNYNGISKAHDEFKNNLDLYSLTKLRVYGKLLDPEIFIVKFDEIIEYIKTENKLMKNKKIDLLKAIGRENLINPKDYEDFDLNGLDKPEDYMDEETFKKAKFQMLTIKEKEEYLKEVENKANFIEIKKPMEECLNV